MSPSPLPGLVDTMALGAYGILSKWWEEMIGV